MKIFALIAGIFVTVALIYTLVERHRFQSWKNAGRERILSTQAPKDRDNPLPPLLENYLKQVLRTPPNSPQVTFTQKGLFRLKPVGEPTPFEAQQWVALGEPMFSWEAQMSLGGMPVAVCDRLVKEEGELQARLFSTFTVAQASGPKMLRGELLRYLAELPWYPVAIQTLPGLVWKQIPGSKLQGTLTVGAISATVEYTFDAQGLVESIYVPDREKVDGDQAVPTPWMGEFSQYAIFEGMLIPTHGEVSWLLPEGKFTYFVGDITSYRSVSPKGDL